jgi:hypothetical protein
MGFGFAFSSFTKGVPKLSEQAVFPSFERAEQYRRLAREAVRKAESAPSPYFRLSFLSLAAGWRALAEQTEQVLQECDEWQREFLYEQIGEPRPKHAPSPPGILPHRHPQGSKSFRTVSVLRD